MGKEGRGGRKEREGGRRREGRAARISYPSDYLSCFLDNLMMMVNQLPVPVRGWEKEVTRTSLFLNQND